MNVELEELKQLLTEKGVREQIKHLLLHWTEQMVRRYFFDERIVERETVAEFVASSSALFWSATSVVKM